MPQLDTSTWFTTIMSMLITLFIMLQLAISKYTYTQNPELKSKKMMNHKNPWEIKWTKIYSPHSLPL
uniref:ATP synthase complex subunit 8 n=2 Tax=Solenodon paradoxus TaxID=79805 RepID=A0A3G1FI72_SOLPA|nr:ATP synthase F0 subunit 8 [Solenodon paradoxus paradoxus]AOT98840.1 ATP synthase F0 subunit 8 [Solenodon paradoxus woodi]AOT98853.1 ATP synthase F0 subunit 8 [Solenodon paradoxus woodi]AOT98866.1 ATP synthase F0 subunit 8 [Solenodon paradoxus woodi]AOT98879.1 ATP synthase F0 subunit 8 [Solenodon paradoxus woodi]